MCINTRARARQAEEERIGSRLERGGRFYWIKSKMPHTASCQPSLEMSSSTNYLWRHPVRAAAATNRAQTYRQHVSQKEKIQSGLRLRLETRRTKGRERGRAKHMGKVCAPRLGNAKVNWTLRERFRCRLLIWLASDQRATVFIEKIALGVFCKFKLLVLIAMRRALRRIEMLLCCVQVSNLD